MKSLSESRRSNGGATSLRIGKAERKQVVKKSLSFESASEESRALSPVSEVSDGLYSADSGKKRLSSEFTSVSKDMSLVSEVSGGSQSEKSPVVDIPASMPPDTFSVGLSPTSEITTYIQEEVSVNTSVNSSHHGDSAYSKFRLIEVDVVAEQLKYDLLQIQNSTDIDDRSKKLLNVLIKTVMEEFNGIHEESDLLSKVVRSKTCVAVTCLLLWMIFTLVAVYVNCYTDTPFEGPPAT